MQIEGFVGIVSEKEENNTGGAACYYAAPPYFFGIKEMSTEMIQFLFSQNLNFGGTHTVCTRLGIPLSNRDIHDEVSLLNLMIGALVFPLTEL